MVQMFTSDRRQQMQWQPNPNAQPTQPAQPAQPTQSVPMPSESGITPPLFKGVQPSGPLSSSVTIPSGVQPPPHMGERPHDAPQNGPFPPQQSSSFYIGAGMGPLEEHVPGDPTRELPQATNRVGHGTDDFGNPLPSYA